MSEKKHKEDKYINFLLKKGKRRQPKLRHLYCIFLSLKQVSEDLVVLEIALNKPDTYLLKQLVNELVQNYYERDGEVAIPYPRERYWEEMVLLFDELCRGAFGRIIIQNLLRTRDTLVTLLMTISDFLDSPARVMRDEQSKIYFKNFIDAILSLIEEELE